MHLPLSPNTQNLDNTSNPEGIIVIENPNIQQRGPSNVEISLPKQEERVENEDYGNKSVSEDDMRINIQLDQDGKLKTSILRNKLFQIIMSELHICLCWFLILWKYDIIIFTQ